MEKQKLIVTIRDGTLLKQVNLLPKNIRGKVVEKALASFFDTPEGKGLTGLFKAPRESQKAEKVPAKNVLGDFGEGE